MPNEYTGRAGQIVLATCVAVIGPVPYMLHGCSAHVVQVAAAVVCCKHWLNVTFCSCSSCYYLLLLKLWGLEEWNGEMRAVGYSVLNISYRSHTGQSNIYQIPDRISQYDLNTRVAYRYHTG